MGKTTQKRYYRKPRKISIWDSKKKRWKTVSTGNPNYEWKNGEFVRKPCM